jgi:hypothetical protein
LKTNQISHREREARGDDDEQAVFIAKYFG